MSTLRLDLLLQSSRQEHNMSIGTIYNGMNYDTQVFESFLAILSHVFNQTSDHMTIVKEMCTDDRGS